MDCVLLLNGNDENIKPARISCCFQPFPLLHTFFKAAIPWFAPVIIRANVPGKSFAVAGATNKFVLHIIIHIFCKKIRCVISFAGGKATFMAIKIKMINSCFIKEVCQVACKLTLQIKIWKKHLAGMVEQFSGNIIFFMCRNGCAESAALAIQ